MNNATEFLMVMRERHWRQLHAIEGEPDYCGGCLNSKSWPCYESVMLDEIKAENARLRAQAEALAVALEQWKCFYCHGRKIEPCRCDGQTCRPGCSAGAACHVCEGTGLDKVARAALRAFREATP